MRCSKGNQFVISLDNATIHFPLNHIKLIQIQIKPHSSQASTSTAQNDKNKVLCVTYDGEADWSAYSVVMEKDFALMAQIAGNEEMQESEDVEIKYAPLPEDVKDNVYTKACLDDVKHYMTHSFIVNDRLQGEIKNLKKTKEKQKELKRTMKCYQYQ